MAHSESWVSEELQAALAGLSAQQARGVQRIVQAELAGQSLSSLLDCAGQICTSTTYYGSGRRRGWRDKPAFQQALALARRDYRQWMLHSGVDEALSALAETAPHAARALRQQVVGDAGAIEALVEALSDGAAEVRRQAAVQLGGTGQPAVVAALREALGREREPLVREALVEALGAVAGLRDGERRLAAASVLDRAGLETAVKATQAQTGLVAYVDVTEGEMAAITEALRREAEDSGAE
jgi:hypothetical protein